MEVSLGTHTKFYKALCVATLLVTSLVGGCETLVPGAKQRHQWSIEVHGGAGIIERARMDAQTDAQYRAAMSAALERGAALLRNGGSSLDAVVAVIAGMEDDPLFNAGRGAVFTAEGKSELDASVMDGR